MTIPSWLRERFYVILVVGYVVTIVLSYLYYGVVFQFTLGLISLALLPVVVLLGQAKQYLKEFTPFLILLLSYEALQGVAGTLAAAHGIASMYTLDTNLWGTNLTGDIQTMFYSSFLTGIATLLYSLHFPMVAIAAVLLWHSSKTHYRRYVYALLMSSYFSLFVFVLMPTAPPWYVGAAANLVQSQSPSPFTGLVSVTSAVTSSIESDKFAAFPSLHAAYAILFAYFTTAINRKYGLVTIPVSLGVLFSTLYLGQHYLIDLIAGSVVAFTSIYVGIKLCNFPSASETRPRLVMTSAVKKSLRARLWGLDSSSQDDTEFSGRKSSR